MWLDLYKLTDNREEQKREWKVQISDLQSYKTKQQEPSKSVKTAFPSLTLPTILYFYSHCFFCPFVQ